MKKKEKFNLSSVNKKTMYIAAACLLAVIVIFIILLVCLRDKAEYKVICSYDFNEEGGIPEGIGTESYSEGAFLYRSDKDGIDGTGCLVITAESENDARFTFKYNEAVPKSYYRISAWVKTSGVASDTANSDNSPVGANISILNTSSRSSAYAGDTDWTYIEYYARTGSNQTSFTAALRLGFYSGTIKGTAYFDDFMIEQLDSLPEGAHFDSMEETISGSVNYEAKSQYDDTMLAASLMLLCLIIYLIIAARYAYIRQKQHPVIKQDNIIDFINGDNKTGARDTSLLRTVLILIAIGFVIRIVMSFTMPQCDIDVNLFQYWGLNLDSKGIPDFYASAEEMNLDYPPLFMYWLYILGNIGNAFEITKTALFDVLLKLPSIAADCVISYIIYKIASKRMSAGWTLFVTSLWIFNPVSLLDSACWGQVDSILALAILISAYYIEKERYGFAASALAFAVTLKPQGIFFIPILGFALIRQLIRDTDIPLNKRIMRFAYSLCSFFITALIIVFPFGYKEGLGIFRWIVNLYAGTAGGYKYASVNALNFFYMIKANWVQDSGSFMGMTYFAWGIFAIVIICLVTGALYICGRNKNSHVYLYSAMLIYAVAVFGPRMHERYFYPAVVLLLLAVIYSNNKILLGIYSILCVSNFYTVLEIMTGLSIGGKFSGTDTATSNYFYYAEINTPRMLMCVINVLCSILLGAYGIYASYEKNHKYKDKLLIWSNTDEGAENITKQVTRNPSKKSYTGLYTRITLLVIAVLISASLLTGCSAGIKIKNADFESVSETLPESWSVYNYRKDYDGDSSCTNISVSDSGINGRCVLIDSKSKNDARIYQEIKVKSDSYYKVQFDTLYEGIDEKAAEGERGAGLNISAINSTGRSGGLYGTVSEWQTVTVYFHTASSQKKAELSIGIGGYSSESYGKAYIDNVRVERVKSLPDGEAAFEIGSMSDTDGSKGGSGIWLKLLFFILSASVIAFVIAVSVKADKEAHENNSPLSQKNPLLGKRDFIILIVMTVICSAFSFYRLGSTKVPSSYWKAARDGEYVIVEFENEVNVSRTVYSYNIPTNGGYSLYYENSDGTFVNAFDISSGSFFAWEQKDVSFTTKRVKIEANDFKAVNSPTFKNDDETGSKWTLQSAGDSNDEEHNTFKWHRGNSEILGTPSAICIDEAAGVSQDERLISPIFNLSYIYGTVNFDYSIIYGGFGNGGALTVEITKDGGNTWDVIWDASEHKNILSGAEQTYKGESIDIPEKYRTSGVQICFHYSGSYTGSDNTASADLQNPGSAAISGVDIRGVGLPINELGFFTKNENGQYEKLNVKVVETSFDSSFSDESNPAMLFDEQDTVEPYSSYMTSTYFDEIYFPRTAYEHIHGFPVYETTHPPMGKIIISLGIRLFGMNPLGWRFMGTLFGVALVPLMYLLGLKIFKKRIYAFGAAFLMMFDFMRLAQTRLATIDSYSSFFIILMYYFMYDYFTQKSYEKKPFWKSLIPLLLCGIMFGLGASTKWVCIYTGVGLAFLFFLAKYLEADDMVSGRVAEEYKKKPWFTHNFVPTCIACIVFFIIIPGAIYMLSYIPYMAPSPDRSLTDIVIENQSFMYNYHSGLTQGHPYGSPWYTWPFNIRPIYYYSGNQANIASGMGTSIVSMGNPLIWWTGFACIGPALFYTWKRRDKGMLIVFVGYAVQLFPWILVTRVAFIYHYFTSVPFIIFMIIYVIKNLIEDGIISKHVMWIYFALVLLLFVLFYPVLTAREVTREYINSLRWFSTWSF